VADVVHSVESLPRRASRTGGLVVLARTRRAAEGQISVAAKVERDLRADRTCRLPAAAAGRDRVDPRVATDELQCPHDEGEAGIIWRVMLRWCSANSAR
jgi:hypothetical protein